MEYIIFIPLFIHQVLISLPDQKKLFTVFDQAHIVYCSHTGTYPGIRLGGAFIKFKKLGVGDAALGLTLFLLGAGSI